MDGKLHHLLRASTRGLTFVTRLRCNDWILLLLLLLLLVRGLTDVHSVKIFQLFHDGCDGKT